VKLNDNHRDPNHFLFNNTFFGGKLDFNNHNGDGINRAEDNFFDHTVIAGTADVHGHNGYIVGQSRLQPAQGSDQTVTSAQYAPGPLGAYYYTGATLSTLENHGSRNVADAGQSAYTVRVDQAQDSGWVDIGFHYVAASPLDVAFIMDNTGSMDVYTLTKLREGIDIILDNIETLSSADYRLALVTPDEDQVNVRLCFAANNRAAFTSALNGNLHATGGSTPESTDECLNTVVNHLWGDPLRDDPRGCTPTGSARQNIDFLPAFRTTSVRKFVVLVTDHEPGGFCSEGDSGAKAADYASQAHDACIRINSIQVDNNSDATPIMLDYYHTSCGWYEQLPGDGTGVVEAVIRMLYDPGYCSCP